MLTSPDLSTLAAIAATSLILWAGYRLTKTKRRRPPGPAPRVLVGNLYDFPTGGYEWLAYEKMARQTGSDVVYLNALGMSVLVLNSFEAARGLLDKKGVLYSSRPRLVMVNELMGWGWNLVLMAYGKAYTVYRRVVQQHFQPSVVQELYHPVMSREVAALLRRSLTQPDGLLKHIKLMTGAIIMMVTYGHQVTSEDDEYVALAEAVREAEEEQPGATLVDILPILKHVPAWFPGAHYKRKALLARKLSERMRYAPFEMVKRRLASGAAVQPSMVSRILQRDPAGEEMDLEQLAVDCGGVVYSAGADTTAVALMNFALAMMLYPDVQTRAQKELDDIVGRDRLPTFEDRPRLPYVSRVVKESLRWRAVSCLGVPHCTLDDDVYRGAHIPKGTTVLANIAAMQHDPSVYADPYAFDPDRFLPSAAKPSGEPDPARAAFGFGRRICPGRFFAEDSVWLAVASLLHAFVLADPTGLRDVSRVHWKSGLVNSPLPFPLAVAPRFAGVHELVGAVNAP
ncbi:cytochrome P450 [Vararia minispora EC-137]|uniref:Cytochrome P450 n=1 Tax=Vararia minispora EC-137 TaxID=1314806 RepID=A0ACB8QQ57_9AGAM|nr:cytochrome P450 [Vararia minispora EC-137]